MGIGREGTRGTGVAPEFWIPHVNYTINSKATKARSTEGLGVINSYGSDSIVTEQWAEGDLEYEVNVNSWGLILYALFGTCSSAAVVDSSYTHTYSVEQTNQHDSLTIHLDDPNNDKTFERAMVSGMTLTIEPDAMVMCTTSFQSNMDSGGGQVASYSTDYKFASPDLYFEIAAATGDLHDRTDDESNGICLKSLTLTFEKNLERDLCLGTVQARDILNKNITISGDIELMYENDTYRNHMLNGDYRAVRIDLYNERDTIGAATHPQFTLDLSRVDFEGWDVDRSLDSIAQESISFSALYDFTNENVVNNCQLVNSHNTY